MWAPIRRDPSIALEESIYENTSCIFTWSTNVTETLIHEYGVPRKKVLCVGVGTNVPLDEICQLPIVTERYRSKRIVFVGRSVARRWELKWGPELIAAFERVLKVHGDAKLTIVGCDPQIRDPSIEVFGTVPLDQVIEHFARSTVFCMPTKMEPFGIVFLEALAAGLPVVALRLGATRDFVIPGRTGELVEPGDIEGLAQALISLLDDPGKCQTYGRNGRMLVQEKYSWDRVFEKMGDRIYEITQNSKTGCPHFGKR